MISHLVSRAIDQCDEAIAQINMRAIRLEPSGLHVLDWTPLLIAAMVAVCAAL